MVAVNANETPMLQLVFSVMFLYEVNTGMKEKNDGRTLLR